MRSWIVFPYPPSTIRFPTPSRCDIYKTSLPLNAQYLNTVHKLKIRLHYNDVQSNNYCIPVKCLALIDKFANNLTCIIDTFIQNWNEYTYEMKNFEQIQFLQSLLVLTYKFILK